ncbi:hypothetical protein M4R23_07305 [Acidovorax sp. GBBC 3332]|nr:MULTISPECIES: hypothetical protein [unclassified Acidovorax]MDA8449216.1 hypothetical protein [Acidovorax sp. GBBC 3297]MDA8458696.1 hypothetical protein [Acidovorax sp. GBBC 3333]MDA8463972.1 hypothetical protein [Acidovorax sp. GBBC 3332]MDA8469004.1 hypothetical protein [Acidovorax sp. GBBC 3299]WCM80602.1 hypothetical protein M5C94_10110 [Acidovorax sp. GBBC 712]
MSKKVDVNAYIVRNGSVEPFLLEISESTPSGEDDFYCVVHMPGVLKKDTKILGIDEAQATMLAIDFAKSMLGDAKIVDANGIAIKW